MDSRARLAMSTISLGASMSRHWSTTTGVPSMSRTQKSMTTLYGIGTCAGVGDAAIAASASRRRGSTSGSRRRSVSRRWSASAPERPRSASAPGGPRCAAARSAASPGPAGVSPEIRGRTVADAARAVGQRDGLVDTEADPGRVRHSGTAAGEVPAHPVRSPRRSRRPRSAPTGRVSADGHPVGRPLARAAPPSGRARARPTGLGVLAGPCSVPGSARSTCRTP